MRKPRNPILKTWHTLTPLIVLALALLGTAPVLASGQATSYVGQEADTFNVTWTVAPSAQYTVMNNGTQPVITYNNCLITNSTYTINFSVTVDTQATYDARFATVGEETQNLNIAFEPGSIAGSGTMTFNATATIRTLDRTVSDARRFGIYLEPEPRAAPLGDSFLTVDINCIVAAGQPEMPGTLPDTGTGGISILNYPLAYMLVAVLLLTTGAYLRRRLTEQG